MQVNLKTERYINLQKMLLNVTGSTAQKNVEIKWR